MLKTKITGRSYKMIVKERNFNNGARKDFKNLIITDLFDKIGIALSTKRKEVTDELVEEMTARVDSYFYTLTASDTPLSCLLPDRLKDARDFYIFAVRVLPTGGILITFIALLGDDVDPVELQLVY